MSAVKGNIRITYNTERTQLSSFANSNSVSAGQLVTNASPARLCGAFKLIHEKYSRRENDFIDELQEILNSRFIEHLNSSTILES